MLLPRGRHCRAGAHRRDHVHGRRDRQTACSSSRSPASASPSSAIPYRPRSKLASYASAGADDRLAMIIGMAPMGARPRRRRRTERATGTRCRRGLVFATIATLIFVPVVFKHGAQTRRREARPSDRRTACRLRSSDAETSVPAQPVLTRRGLRFHRVVAAVVAGAVVVMGITTRRMADARLSTWTETRRCRPSRLALPDAAASAPQLIFQAGLRRIRRHSFTPACRLSEMERIVTVKRSSRRDRTRPTRPADMRPKRISPSAWPQSHRWRDDAGAWANRSSASERSSKQTLGAYSGLRTPQAGLEDQLWCALPRASGSATATVGTAWFSVHCAQSRIRPSACGDAHHDHGAGDDGCHHGGEAQPPARQNRLCGHGCLGVRDDLRRHAVLRSLGRASRLRVCAPC